MLLSNKLHTHFLIEYTFYCTHIFQLHTHLIFQIAYTFYCIDLVEGMWSLTRKKAYTGQFLLCELRKVSTFNFWKVRTSHHLGSFFTGRNFCWCQQKLEIHTSQQQKIVWRRITPLWNLLTKKNSFKYVWLWFYIFYTDIKILSSADISNSLKSTYLTIKNSHEEDQPLYVAF